MQIQKKTIAALDLYFDGHLIKREYIPYTKALDIAHAMIRLSSTSAFVGMSERYIGSFGANKKIAMYLAANPASKHDNISRLRNVGVASFGLKCTTTQ